MTRRRRGGIKRGETKLVISSLCVLHSPEYPERFTKLGREENGEGGDRGDLGEKKGERAIKPVTTLLSKNGY